MIACNEDSVKPGEPNLSHNTYIQQSAQYGTIVSMSNVKQVKNKKNVRE